MRGEIGEANYVCKQYTEKEKKYFLTELCTGMVSSFGLFTYSLRQQHMLLQKSFELSHDENNNLGFRLGLIKNGLYNYNSHKRDIPIGVSLYSTPTGTAYIEQLVDIQKSTRTAKKGNTVSS